MTREEILKDFTHTEQAVIMSVPAATNVEDLTKFATLSKYFRGEHHLEEMMYHENCPRSVLLQLMDKFRMVLVKHEHKDPAVSMYFKVHLLHQTLNKTKRHIGNDYDAIDHNKNWDTYSIWGLSRDS